MKLLSIPRKWCMGIAAMQLGLACLSSQSFANTIIANSPSYSDVTNALARALPGDTVIMPAGTAAWTVPLQFSGIRLVGSGTNNTIIVDDLDRSTYSQSPLIVFGSTSNGFGECSDFQLTHGTTTTENFKGEILASMDLPARVDNMYFNLLVDKNIVTYGTSNGLIDHCTFVLSNTIAISANADGYGDVSWANPVNYGTSNALYIEDCLFTNVIPNDPSSAANDASAGGEEVFRHNTVLNTFFANHGTESGQRYRSARSYEVYDNTFVNANNFTWAIMLRGGSGVIFSNTTSGYNNLCGMFNYRDGESFSPWAGATGNNAWDSNSPTLFFSGSNESGNGSTVAVISGQNGTTNKWVGYTIVDPESPDTSYNFSIITGDTNGTIHVYPSKDFGPMTFNSGDAVQIYLTIDDLDQVGRGSGDLIEGDSPINSVTGQTNWPHEVSEPVYFWANTLNGVVTGGESDYPNIQNGNAYINGTAKPGYIPFVYPHPLDTSDTNQPPPPPPTNSLVAWWPLDEGSGTVAHDISGNGNDGIFGGSTEPQWTNNFLYFNGAGYITCGTNYVPITFPMTISYWVNFGPGGGGTVLDRMIWSNEVNWRCNSSDSDMPTGDGDFADLSFGWEYNIADNNWHLVTETDSPNGDGTATATIYLDSTNIESQTGGSLGTTLTGTPTISMGIESDFASGPFTGYIADVRIYTNVLSASAIQTLYTNGPTHEIAQGLVAWWKFDDGSGTTAVDSSGNGNNGTLGGSTLPQWSDGALSFNGSGYVTCGTNNVPLTYPMTVSYWEKIGAGGGGTVLDRMIWNNEVNWRCNDSASDMPTGNGDFYDLSFSWAYNIDDNNWHLVTVTDSPNGNGTGTASIYLDSTNVESETGGTFGSTLTGTPTISLGIGSDYVSGPFVGSIDDVRIYTNVLSASQIQTLYENGRQ